MSKSAMFFYTFNVTPENEEKFSEYMKNYGTPVMSKYCKNWNFFKLNKILTGDNVPQYIGYFEIPNLDVFLKSEPPEEMKEIIGRASKISSNTKEWVSELIATNLKD